MKRYWLNLCALLLGSSAFSQNITYVENPKGPTLGYAEASGVKIIKKGSLSFKDLNRNGKLDKYEDWRLPIAERAKDLASQMSIEQIAGLMLYSSHQEIPARAHGYFAGLYGGKSFNESGVKPWDLTDQQKTFVKDDNLRHVLVTTLESPEVAARWNNNLQAFVESQAFGIPSNNSSDPRHTASATAEFNAGAGGKISLWPDGLALGATFNPEIVQQFGKIAAQEYRALGITTALSPQIDLGTEPRWYRISYVFSESPTLTTAMARAYIDGLQTSSAPYEIAKGWGFQSVNAMAKHWPGGGPEEGGRDAHWAMGKYAVYPGKNMHDHIMPFSEGAFKLNGGTATASAIMPYYTISYDQDIINRENVGNGFSKYLIKDILRGQYGFDGVVCTDWGITANEGVSPATFAGKPWGVEQLSVAERHYKALMAGVDQFGGNNDKKPVLEAYAIGVKEHGEKYMRQRFEQSAIRLLSNILHLGLFENPYLDIENTKNVVGNPDFMKAGFDAQLKSVVLLKNHESVLPLKDRKTVYIPKIYQSASFNWWGVFTEPTLDYPVDIKLIEKYYNVTNDPTKADLAIVFIKSPVSDEGGYSETDRKQGGNGYVPISLQYGTYKASTARAQSLAAGDPVVDPGITNRSFKDKVTTASNYTDLLTIHNTRKVMQDKPVIVSVTASKPMIFSEFENQVDAIVLNFNISTQAVLEIIAGKYEPSGLLPLQMPANMETVERQKEDVPFDMDVYIDSDGNAYDFGFGLNWKGLIQDMRTQRFKRLTTDM